MERPYRRIFINSDGTLEKLLFHYRFWGIAAACFFVICITLLMILIFVPAASLDILYVVLLSGFLWIGSTSFSRHALVVLKRYIGREMSMIEFFSTQFVAVLFPLAYRKVRNEVKAFRERRELEPGND